MNVLPFAVTLAHPPAPLIVGAAALGLVCGSFTTALSYRVPRGISIADGRSRCSACNRPLRAQDLIPVVSWTINRGRCAQCGAKVSARYPAIELTSMGLFVAIVLFRTDLARVAILALVTPALMALAITDLEQRLLPNRLLAAVLPLVLLWRWVDTASLLPGLAAAAAVLILGYGAAHFAGKATSQSPLIGGGDIKLLALAALALPVPQILIFMIIAGVFGVIFGLCWTRAYHDRRFPFGPALVSALWLGMAVPLSG